MSKQLTSPPPPQKAMHTMQYNKGLGASGLEEEAILKHHYTSQVSVASRLPFS